MATTNSIELKNLPKGNYRMFAYDVNNCETIIGPYTINVTPKLVIIANTGTIINDGCSLQRGSIKGVVVNGGIPTYDFKWVNAAGKAVQYTQEFINIGAGVYRLEVRDKTTCGYAISEEYTILDEPFKIPAPIVNDMRVCYVSDILLPVTTLEEGTYQMFEKIDDSKPILETKNDMFNFKVTKTADYFIRRKLGSYINEFTKVHIEVTHDNLEVPMAMAKMMFGW